MREFNKVFVIALPRCATVSMSDALGLVGVPISHLGRIYGEQTTEHNNPRRLMRIHEQIMRADFELDILKQCRGLADYPACCVEVFRRLDLHYPNSLFINVRRDRDVMRWIQSVERQFVGLQLVKQGKTASEEEQAFMKVMLSFREMTFGQWQFDSEVYLSAYHDYQRKVTEYFSDRRDSFLDIADVSDLEQQGFTMLSEFLNCEVVDLPFPNNNDHSIRPYQAFMQAIEDGKVHSQTGIKPVMS